MKQTEINDGLGVVAILVEQFRDITLKSASAVRALVELDVDSDSLKAFVDNETSKGAVLIAVLSVLTTIIVSVPHKARSLILP